MSPPETEAHPPKRAQAATTGPQGYLPVLLWGLLTLAFFLGCSRADPEALPEWTPADHDHQEEPTQGQVDTTKKRAGMPSLERQGVNDVILATWKQTCMTCHGVIGRGDGPQGRVLQPPDFTKSAFQAARSDEALAATIKTGKGQMPAFAHLPEETVDGLVKLIRLLGADRDGATKDPKGSEETGTGGASGSGAAAATGGAPAAGSQAKTASGGSPPTAPDAQKSDKP